MTLCNFVGSPVAALYEQLCAEEGIDDGDPLVYGSYALLEPSEEEPYLLDADDPYSLADRVANVLAIATSHPITWSRLIWSADDFQTSHYTRAIHHGGPQTDFLEGGGLVLDDETIGNAERMWTTTLPLWRAEKATGRITNALSYFYYAWRAQYIEHACLNLAIALEVLFAPHAQSEATHQLSFNLAHFAGADPSEREDIYGQTKRFYAIRSAIVHGGIPDDTKIGDVTADMFHLTAQVLRRILIDSSLATTFNDPTARKALWKSYLFS